MKNYKCSYCKKKFKRYQSTVRNESKVYCSRVCKSEHQKIYNLGDNNPNYKSGKYINRGKRLINRWMILDEIINKIISSCFDYQEVTAKVNKCGLRYTRSTITKRIKNLKLDIKHFRPGKNRSLSNENLFCISTIRRNGILKQRILEDKLITYQCAWCKLKPRWRNHPLVLELDHINGNSVDNRLSNLRFLCPNCHSQTTTNKGKNSRRIK